MSRLSALASSRVGAAALLALLVAGGAGAFVALSPATSSSPLDAVPGGVDYVGHLDVDRMESDAALANTSRQAFRFQSRVAFYDGPPFRESFVFRAAGPDASGVDSVTYFGRTNGSAYDARVVEADWRPAAVVRGVETVHNVTLTRVGSESSLYVGGGYAVAVLSEGRFAVGNATAVGNAVAVAEGERDPVSGPLRRELARKRDGYARFAFRFDPSKVPDRKFVESAVKDVNLVATAYHYDGTTGRMGFSTNVTTDSETTAKSIVGMLAGGQAYYRIRIDDPALDRQFANVTYRLDGRRAVVRYEATPSGFANLLEGLAER